MRRILFVAMQNSPHTSRWIELIADRGWDLHLFPVDSNPPLTSLRGVTIHPPCRVIRWPRTIVKGLRGEAAAQASHDVASSMADLDIEPMTNVPLLKGVDSILNLLKVNLGEPGINAPILHGPFVLRKLIERLKPDLVHSMEFQHCGYNVLGAKRAFAGRFPPWLATNWGSDIFYYRRFPNHAAQIRQLLRGVDFYSCECERDVTLARELGMTATVLPVIPNSGGFDLVTIKGEREAERPSDRKLIMIKGYQHFAGRALTALEALEKCAHVLNGYKVLVFSAPREVERRVAAMKAETGIDISVLNRVGHSEMLRLYARSRVYVGISVSDAISTSLLEAMAMGTFPIQTDTACCDEWIGDGEGGFIVPVDDVDLIASRIERALRDDALVNRASKTNWCTVEARLDRAVLKAKAIDFYDRIFAGPQSTSDGHQARK